MVTHCQKETLSSGEETSDVGMTFGEATVMDGCTGDTGKVPDIQSADEERAKSAVESSGMTG